MKTLTNLKIQKFTTKMFALGAVFALLFVWSSQSIASYRYFDKQETLRNLKEMRAYIEEKRNFLQEKSEKNVIGMLDGVLFQSLHNEKADEKFVDFITSNPVLKDILSEIDSDIGNAGHKLQNYIKKGNSSNYKIASDIFLYTVQKLGFLYHLSTLSTEENPVRVYKILNTYIVHQGEKVYTHLSKVLTSDIFLQFAHEIAARKFILVSDVLTQINNIYKDEKSFDLTSLENSTLAFTAQKDKEAETKEDKIESQLTWLGPVEQSIRREFNKAKETFKKMRELEHSNYLPEANVRFNFVKQLIADGEKNPQKFSIFLKNNRALESVFSRALKSFERVTKLSSEHSQGDLSDLYASIDRIGFLYHLSTLSTEENPIQVTAEGLVSQGGKTYDYVSAFVQSMIGQVMPSHQDLDFSYDFSHVYFSHQKFGLEPLEEAISNPEVGVIKEPKYD